MHNKHRGRTEIHDYTVRSGWKQFSENRNLRFRVSIGLDGNKITRARVVAREGKWKESHKLPLCFGDPTALIWIDREIDWLGNAPLLPDLSQQQIFDDHTIYLGTDWYLRETPWDTFSNEKMSRRREQFLEPFFEHIDKAEVAALRSALCIETCLDETNGQLIWAHPYEVLIGNDPGTIALIKGIASVLSRTS